MVLGKKLLARAHVALYRATRGVIGARFGRIRMLVLTSRGRRTGRTRDTPLLYVLDGPNLAVVASNYGSGRPPHWYLNLLARPQAVALIGPKRLHVRARIASPEERARLWPKAVTAYSRYEAYRVRSTRDIPIVVLEPTGHAPQP